MITKTEIKKQLKEELKCPTDFIERCLNKEGRIDHLKEYADDKTEWQLTMNMIYDEWKDYCDAWELDPEADNRGFKPKLWKI